MSDTAQQGAVNDMELSATLWTYVDLCRASKLSRSTLQRYVASGELEALRFGANVRFDPETAMRQVKEIGARHVQGS